MHSWLQHKPAARIKLGQMPTSQTNIKLSIFGCVCQLFMLRATGDSLDTQIKQPGYLRPPTES